MPSSDLVSGRDPGMHRDHIVPDLEPAKTLAEALVQLQAQLPHVAKEQQGQVGERPIKYADLTTVTEALFPILTSLGLSFTSFPTLREDGKFVLRYKLRHVCGEDDGGDYALPASGSPQQLGAAITYARRNALNAVTGLAPAEDGDPDMGDGQEQPARPRRRPRNVPDAELAASGQMTRGEKSAHEHLAADATRSRKAERSHPRGPDPDDPWAQDAPVDHDRASAMRTSVDSTWPEEQSGSSTPSQWQQLGILYGQIGITERETRLAEMTDRCGREITSAKDLSYAEAESAIRSLRELAAKEGAKT
jgi:ERF superfamily